MANKPYRALSIGAHPDDADTSAGGLLWKLRDSNWEIRLLSVTDGSAGTYHPDMTREALAAIRRKEAEKSGLLFGGRYDVLNHPDGQLEPTLTIREELIRYIRDFKPDLIITNRLCDYHADHRSTAQLVQDASFLLTVPHICKDTPYLEDTPTILYWGDGFTRPQPFHPDLIVPLSENDVQRTVSLACCHECQYFDWMYWPHHTEKITWPREKQVADLSERFFNGAKSARARVESRLVEKYGKEIAAKIRFVRLFEISEYGSDPSKELLEIIERVDQELVD